MNNLKTQRTCEIYTEQNMSSKLKKELCKKLLKSGKLTLYDVIRYSYTNNKILNEQTISNNICPTLDTRCDCLGVVVKGEEDD